MIHLFDWLGEWVNLDPPTMASSQGQIDAERKKNVPAKIVSRF